MPFQQGMPLNANGEVVIGVLPAGSYFRFMAKRIGGNSASLHSDTITTDHGNVTQRAIFLRVYCI